MRIRYKFLIFCFVGGIAFLIDFVVFNLFSLLLGPGLLMSQITRILGIVLSMFWNFTANRRFTFGAIHGKIKKQLPRWLAVYIISSLLNLIIFSAIIFIIGGEFLQRNVAFIIGAFVSLIFNFSGSQFWIFKKTSD